MIRFRKGLVNSTFLLQQGWGKQFSCLLGWYGLIPSFPSLSPLFCLPMVVYHPASFFLHVPSWGLRHNLCPSIFWLLQVSPSFHFEFSSIAHSNLLWFISLPYSSAINKLFVNTMGPLNNPGKCIYFEGNWLPILVPSPVLIPPCLEAMYSQMLEIWMQKSLGTIILLTVDLSSLSRQSIPVLSPKIEPQITWGCL